MNPARFVGAGIACAVSLSGPACGGTSTPAASLTGSTHAQRSLPSRGTTTSASGEPAGPRPAAPTLRLSAGARRQLAQVLRDSGAAEGSIALQRLDGSTPARAGDVGSPYAWSSIKPVIVATLLKLEGGPDGLGAEQQARVRAALTASDNDAAMALFQAIAARTGGVGGAADAMTRLLRAAGDRRTRVSTVGRGDFSPYGQTLWEPAAQVRFMSALARGCLLDRGSTAYLLGVMNEVIPAQRWGFGTLRSVTALKGGWGPDPDGRYLVRQVGLTDATRGEPVAFAAAVRPADGSFETGTRILEAVAAWTRGLHLRGGPARSCGQSG